MLSALIAAGDVTHADREAERFFESNVRPLLIENCSKCHGEQKQSGGLRIDSLSALLKGGDSGPAIVPGRVEASRIIQAVRREDGLEMPPDDELSDAQIAVLTRWIEQGAVWPESQSAALASSADAALDHWAFQPIRRPAIPEVAQSDWPRTPVDAFVLAKLEAAGLTPSPEADRRTLIRRATYTLTGLPPTPDEVAEFTRDPDPEAYARLIERLLDSPPYGEQWARHWLDVARYSDTKGYVYAREERFWVHAWVYRDWVVRAFNSDMPYDRFLLLQIAADQVPDRAEGDLAAMGFLTLGPRFLGVKRDIIDDRIDVVCRGTMGLTVACARCHDHKYDPIPTADYYSLYGVFDSCAEELVPLAPRPDDEEFRKGLQLRREKLRSTFAQRRAETSARARRRVKDYLHAQTELDKFPAEGFYQILSKDDLIPTIVRRWERYLREAQRANDPVFVPWHAFAALAEDEFPQLADRVTGQLHEGELGAINPLVAAVFAAPPQSFAEVIERYATLFTDINARWEALEEEAAALGAEPPVALEDPAAEQLRCVLYVPASPCEVPDETIVTTESYFDEGTVVELWKLQGDVDRWIIESSVPARHALTLVDRPVPTEPRVFIRGDPLRQGEDVPRQFVSLLAGDDRTPFAQGSGRLELAEAVIDPANPLTARVIVNRVWMHHFGEGLVTTPSDFGRRAAEPSHPELLDWLAARLIESGWSLKALHRLILNSATYRQSSSGPSAADVLAAARRMDPTNRLLWRMNRHRLTFEEFRDSLLAASGELDRRVGGKPSALFKPPYPVRRSLYGLVDRQFLPSTLRMFDFANPDLHTPQRPETTVPQQALFLMNDPLVLEQARALADGIIPPDDAEERVRALFQETLQRNPTERERQEGVQFVTSAVTVEAPPPPVTARDWQYGYGAFDEARERVEGFTPLPHFTGSAWQGGPQYPDPQLGWVQLTATGGHPGNNRAHAAVRRWTAPRAMTVEIRSTLVHEPTAGDGIRAFIVCSQAGLLESAAIHHKRAELNVAPFAVRSGEALDFVVDIGEVLNSDQYQWSATITQVADWHAKAVWNSETDFSRVTVEPLTVWEQLAHVLLCSNEFLFVD
jgi:hypothetical protein